RADANEAEIAESLKKAFRTPSDIRVRSHTNASEQLGRLLTTLNDFLGLVALIALFMASIGGAYLFRSFVTRKARDVAILVALGASFVEARRVYVYQLLILGSLAATLSIALSTLLLPILQDLVAPFLSASVPIR